MSKASIEPAGPSEAELTASLVATYGAIVGGKELARALGFRTQSAFRKALDRGALSVTIFQIPGRRGRFALSTELATWIWRQRQDSNLCHSAGGDATQKP
jgi:hypothetical protein